MAGQTYTTTPGTGLTVDGVVNAVVALWSDAGGKALVGLGQTVTVGAGDIEALLMVEVVDIGLWHQACGVLRDEGYEGLVLLDDVVDAELVEDEGYSPVLEGWPTDADWARWGV